MADLHSWKRSFGNFGREPQANLAQPGQPAQPTLPTMGNPATPKSAVLMKPPGVGAATGVVAVAPSQFGHTPGALPPEPKTLPAAPARPSDGMFLAPRVIDQQGFNDFAGQLRAIIDQAGAATDTLCRTAAQATHQAETATTILNAATNKAQPVLQRAATLSAELGDLIAGLNAAEARVTSANQAAAVAAEHTREQLAALETAKAATLGEFERQLGARSLDITEQLRAAVADAELARQVSTAAVESLSVRAAAQLNDCQARVASMIEQSNQQLAEAQTRATGTIRELVAKPIAMAQSKIDQASIIIGQITATAAQLKGTFSAELGELETATLSRVSDAIQSRLNASLAGTLKHLDRLVGEARVLLGPSDSDPTAPAAGARALLERLTNAIERADTIHDDATFATRQCESIRQQSEIARVALGESICTAAEHIDRLSGLAENLKSSLDSSSATAAMALQQLTTQQSAITKALAQPLIDAQAASEQLRASGKAAAEELTTAQSHALAIRSEADMAISQLRTLLASVEPWQPLLLHGQIEVLPEPLADILDTVRAELCRDIASMAAGMHQVTLKAVAVAEKLKAA